MLRGTLIAAAAVYVLVLGSIIFSGTNRSMAQSQRTAGEGAAVPIAPIDLVTRPSRVVLPLCGAGFQVQRVDWIDRYKQCIDQIAAVGADSVLMVVGARQENGSSCRIYLDMRMTPTPDQMGELIRHAKQLNLRVIIMPIVLLDAPRGNEWRGQIKPVNPESADPWHDWFDSYRAMMTHFAWVAEANQADVLVIGSELVSTEDKVDEWTQTIAQVRKSFTGLLTYSANWDHYTSVPFWNQLDLIGLNSYYKLGDSASATVPQIETRWKIIQNDLLKFQRRIGKPLLFLEVGWCSLANAASEPWDYTKTDLPVDLDLQKRLYEAFFRTWWDVPGLGGFMIWEWTPGEGGPDNKGYTPKNKPAEQVLRDWLAKPRWSVRASGQP